MLGGGVVGARGATGGWALYFHLRKLIGVGLVVEKQAKKNGRHVAAVYDVPGVPRMKYGAGVANGVERVIGAAVRMGERDFVRALWNGAKSEGARREVWGGRVKGWLSAKELVEANQLIDRLSRLVLSGRPGRGKKAQSLTWVFAPAKPGRMTKAAESQGA